MNNEAYHSANYINIPMSNLVIVRRLRTRSQGIRLAMSPLFESVYFNADAQPQQFLEAICARLSKMLPVASLQIVSPIKKYVDVSVGVLNDSAACNFIDSGKRMLLPGENGIPVEHEIVISDAFLSHYRARKEGKIEEERNNESEDKFDHSSSSSSFYDRKRERQAYKRRYEREEEDVRVGFLWVFGIPIDCKEREVCMALAEKGIRVKSYDWKLKEDMEYMQVELFEAINMRELDVLDCRVEKYPLLVLPRLQDQKNVYQHILKHELEINFDKEIDEIELIKLVSKIGGVLALIKDDFYGPRKYVAALNSSLKIEMLTDELNRKYKNCHIQRPKYAVRLGRLEKNFTFTQMVENLAAYEQQM